ncbi:CaiB/BaiF CoA transferase family protein [Pararhodobacter oceanensis]|uniref:CaiB/BaiF CoA transferase family protein n=1 Tax=Pararhodobacter oceanensis TaxID=2172121 RepID=UPI003A8D68E5
MTEDANMLQGYRVLDLSQFVAGPTCARILGELGAEVIKVEMAPGGDRGRASGMRPIAEGLRKSTASTYYFQHNHSKKSLALDLKSHAGKKILLDLVKVSDILVENFSPGVMARMGLAWSDLKQVNPRLVMCSISLAGQEGELSDRPGFDYMGAAYAGVTASLGEPDRAPGQLPIAIGDSATGISAAMAIGFALLHRDRTGRGQHVESTLLDTYFQMHEVNIPKISLKGPSALPERAGSMHPDGGPTGVFRTPGDTAISIMVMPYQWPQFVAATGNADLATDPRFSTPRARRDNKRELADIVETWLEGFASREAALEHLGNYRVPSAPILTLPETMSHPHHIARGTVRKVHDRHIGEFQIPGMPARFSDWPQRSDLSAALLGEHNEEILHQILGRGADEIEEMYRNGVLVRDPLIASLEQPEIETEEENAH